jgi:predicted dehydrogenase
MKDWPDLGHAADAPTPAGVDYDRWLGPAPARPFNPNHFHYKWHLWWDYSGGDIINDGVHQIDAARMLIGKDYPKFISSSGGRYERTDDGDAPNTQVATWDFGDTTMVFELTLNTPYMEKMPWELRDGDEYPNWTYDGMTIQVFGSKGFMYFERHGGGWQVFGEGRKKIAEMNDHHPHIAHIKNFFECLESRKRPNADIEEGHRSTLLCQTANIAYRTGRRLELDPKTERFINDDEANKLVKRVYREPYVIPEEV